MSQELSILTQEMYRLRTIALWVSDLCIILIMKCLSAGVVIPLAPITTAAKELQSALATQTFLKYPAMSILVMLERPALFQSWSLMWTSSNMERTGLNNPLTMKAYHM